MASGPITSWQIDGETVRDFIFLGSKISVDAGCSLEIKRSLLHGRKAMTNLDGVLEKAMATHSSTLAWRIPWIEEPGGLQSMESWRVGHSWATSLWCIGKGYGNPLQCSCLENPRDGGAWWAAIYGVAQSRTWLKRLSSSRRCIKKQRCHLTDICICVLYILKLSV